MPPRAVVETFSGSTSSTSFNEKPALFLGTAWGELNRAVCSVLVEPFHHLIRYSSLSADRLDEFFAKLRERAVENAVGLKCTT